ncbi:MAG: hypothetical protein RMK29_20765 [Myxococcales bacterium]|nr:hypothetical protein [Myxococcota bacterium]MDW8284145.1 hypothetical protein [Myxococcales bacterium]
MRALTLLVLLLVGGGCGSEPPPIVSNLGRLELLEPTTPIGLGYGEQVQIRVRYLHRHQPRAGVRLAVVPVGELGGGTLSAGHLITDGRGEALFALTAGEAEASFSLLVSGPDGAELTIDVAVSRRSFGGVTVVLDRRALGRAAEVQVLRASLLADSPCGSLRPTAEPPLAVRSQRAELRPGQDQAALTFGTLLLRGYTVLGRAEGEGGHLLGWGCLELPEAALVAMPEAQVPLPLADVQARPAGGYLLRGELDLAPGPPGLLETLACPLGAGQALLDALLDALPAREMPLASRLQARRGPPGADRCRPPRWAAEDTADLRLDLLLAGAGLPGAQLRPVALEVRAIQRRVVLTSRLHVRGPVGPDVVADHVLSAAELATGTATVRLDLWDLGLPVLQARDLVLPVTGGRIDLPTHGLTLRLPALWRMAVRDLVLMPRGLVSLERLVDDSVAAARHAGRIGCGAVEALLCELVGPPCAPTLQMACQEGQQAMRLGLQEALRDGPGGLDLSLAGFCYGQDPDARLVAQTLGGGRLQARLLVGSGGVMASGPLAGRRL